ncbi:MAG: Stk1 family PASTA domain-containing Ser/Thr kinase [Coriobacteriia bacterium]|nr:Stk1 family PASTA domain-containing Ser/Thr kinase [Coriobacteriia bacterium]
MQNVLVGKRYRLTEKIGSGGMADVYKATDENLANRPVAVKLMHPQLASDPSFVARFQQEAAAAANLQNPYIVNIYDWGSEVMPDGKQIYYIVMEYVRGEDLKSIIQRTGALPSGKVAEIGAMVCAALNVAHGYDIIHRDIKPHNIMVLPDGNIKVMDFGIARAGNSQMTQTGSVLGSAHYVSPEQAQGKDLNGASDLYSLGVVLYEASTGRMPFDGDSPVATALKQVQEQAVRPTSINPNMDPSLEQVIGFAMAKDPRARYATADDMRRDLLRVARGEPIVGAHGNADDDATRVMGGVVPMGGPRGAQDADGTTVMPAVDAGTAPAGAAMGAGRTIEPEEPKKKKKVWVWIGIILALIAVAGIIAWQLGVFDSEEDPELVAMPMVTGITEEAARERLRDAGVAVIVPENGGDSGIVDALTPPEANEGLITIEEEYSPDVPEGYVISQDPTEGTELDDAAHAAVTLVVSKGERRFAVPDLTGMTLDEARNAVSDANFTINHTTENHNTVPEGQIINQSPSAGDELPGGSTINVVVSAGVASVAIPDVAGLTRQEAINRISNAGLNPQEGTAAHSDTVAEGRVISQNPSPGAGVSIQQGATVTFVISRGPRPPEMVEVPNVSGRNEAAARQAIENAGLRVRNVSHAEGEIGVVISQNPGAGQRVQPNSQVDITIGSGTSDSTE